jgi:hypothetical protein
MNLLGKKKRVTSVMIRIEAVSYLLFWTSAFISSVMIFISPADSSTFSTNFLLASML